ncbi:MAG: peptide chain release factor N(5)-glutamine methyltransferase [Bacilli bacterium]|nr:peptide chain release factor N(5)-glutamine methyltransferase [Bacilli bacterium]
MNKPDYIGDADWKILKDKYKGSLPKEIIDKLERKYPIQYLIGNVEFYNTILEVNESVLIPRFETELLVQKTINLIKENKINPSKIIDLGTGSGAIAISLAKEFNISVDALDISEDALNVAKKNATSNEVKLNLIRNDILNDSIELDHTLIISNPPYVDYEEEVDPQTKYEPQNAIFAENKGLKFYEKIISIAKNNKTKTFWLVFEIGANQKEEIKRIITNIFPNARIICEKDFTNRDRYIFASIS